MLHVAYMKEDLKFTKKDLFSTSLAPGVEGTQSKNICWKPLPQNIKNGKISEPFS